MAWDAVILLVATVGIHTFFQTLPVIVGSDLERPVTCEFADLLHRSGVLGYTSDALGAQVVMIAFEL